MTMRTRTSATLLALLAFVLALASPARAGNVTCTKLASGHFAAGNFVPVSGTCTMSSSYATGGDKFSSANGLDALASALCGSNIRKPVAVFVQGHAAGVLFEFDATNRKIKARTPSAGFTPAGTVAAPTINCGAAAPGAYAQGNTIAIHSDANGAALDCGTAARTGIVGVQAPAFTGTPVAATTAPEVSNGTDLSSITITYLAWCQ